MAYRRDSSEHHYRCEKSCYIFQAYNNLHFGSASQTDRHEIFRLNQNNILATINFIFASFKGVPYTRPILSVSNIAIGIMGFYTGKAFVGFISITNTWNGWTFPSWWERIVDMGRFNFFLEPRNTTASLGISTDLSDVDTFVGILSVFGFFYRRLYGIYTDLFLYILIICVYSATQEFAKKIELKQKLGTASELESWPVIHDEQQNLKQLCNLVNSLLSSNMTCTLITMILHGATSLQEIIILSDDSNGIYADGVKILLLLGHATAFLASADICHQVSKR